MFIILCTDGYKSTPMDIKTQEFTEKSKNLNLQLRYKNLDITILIYLLTWQILHTYSAVFTVKVSYFKSYG